MLSRCYKYSDSTRTYFGRVKVCKEWLCFETFEKWYDENYIEGFKLDKDFTILGAKIYSPDTCCFIPNAINCILGRKDSEWVDKNHNLPVGVSYHKRDNKYTAQCFNGERLVHLGYHSTSESAFIAYKKFKEGIIKKLAKDYYDKGEINSTVYNNLVNYAVPIKYEQNKEEDNH